MSENTKKAIEKVEELQKRRKIIELGGGQERIDKQHAAGRLTARERLETFFDPGSFGEIDAFGRTMGRELGMDKVNLPSDGVIIGTGTVYGRSVAAMAQDYTCIAGTMGEMHGKKIVKITKLAAEWKIPIVGFNESAGARLQEFLEVSKQYGEWFYYTSIYSGVIPQIAVMNGIVAGGQSYQPGLSDFIFMTKDSSTFIAGPPLVEAMTGEKVSTADLGGAKMHSSESGVCHVVAEDEVDCINKVKELLAFLPLNNKQKPPWQETGDDPNRICDTLYNIVPPNPKTPYDMHDVISEIVDNGFFFEIHKDYAKSMVVGLTRFNGYTTGIIANNPQFLAGGIDVWAAEKAARFIRFCDAFNIPLVYLVSTPAYIIGSVQEKLGMIFRGASLLHATSEATVPRITIILGWAYAGAYIAMNSKYMGADLVYAWPTAEIGLVAAEGVVNVVYRKEIAAAANPEEERKKREEAFKDTFMKIYYPASYQHIDDVIDPKDTRKIIIKSFELLKHKDQKLPWKKHGNMPL